MAAQGVALHQLNCSCDLWAWVRFNAPPKECHTKHCSVILALFSQYSFPSCVRLPLSTERACTCVVQSPVRASTARVSAEVTAVAGVARGACGIRIVLDRVLVTRSGTVLACWQVAGGTEPAELRRRLEAALPDASKQQVVTDWSILHMTLARIVAPPTNLELTSPRGMSGALRQAAAAMTQELCGMSATLDEMWCVRGCIY